MVFFNYALRKLNAKIVYYGPGLCGKTTNLQWIHDHFEGGQRGKMLSLATEGDRTIFFDLLPIDIGSIRGMQVTLQLYTVPGQVHYNSTRQLVLRGADGVVFVGDSQRTMAASNLESLKNLEENLALQGVEVKGFPYVLQFNKRDLRDIQSVEEMDAALNQFSVPIFEAVAIEGVGVQETLEGIVKLVMRSLRERYEPVAAGGIHAPGERPVAPAPMARAPVGTPQAPQAPAPPAPVAREAPAPADLAPRPAPAAVEPPEPPTAPPGLDRAAQTVDIGRPTEAASPLATQAPPPGDDFGDFELKTEPEAADFPEFMVEPPGPDDVPTAVFVPPEIEEEPPVADEIALEDAVVEPLMAEEITETGIRSPDAAEEFVIPAPPDEPDVHPADELFHSPPFRGREEKGKEEPESADRLEAIAEQMEAAFEAPEQEAEFEESFEAVAERSEVETPFAAAEEPSETEMPFEDVATAPADDEPGPFEAEPAAAEANYQDRIRAPGPFAPLPPDGELQAVEESPFEDEAAAEEAAAEEPAFLEPEVEPEPPAPVAEEPAMAEPAEDIGAIFDDQPNPEEAAAVPAVDELMASMLEPATEAEPPPVEVEAEAAPIKAEPEAAVALEPEAPPAPAAEPESPFMVDDGDPFADPFAAEAPAATPEVPQPITAEASAVVVPPGEQIVPRVSAIQATPQDTQLRVQLEGSGAVADYGEVREMDIVVPVPGPWIGNRRVTLQLRLTLTPAAEDENDGPDGAS